MVLRRATRSVLSPLDVFSSFSSSSSLLSDLTRLSASAALIATGGRGPLSAHPLPTPSPLTPPPSPSPSPSPPPPPSPSHDTTSGLGKTATALSRSAEVSSDPSGQGAVSQSDRILNTKQQVHHESQGPPTGGQHNTSVMSSGSEPSSSSSSSSPQTGQAKEEDSFDPLATRKYSRIPSSRLGRIFGFGQLAAQMAWRSVYDRVSGSQGDDVRSQGGVSARTAETLAAGLCRMRGSALKLGQMLSIQDENVLPPQVAAALERVRGGADLMPKWQLERVLKKELGDDWRSKFVSFNDEPIAAASIGQVHKATIKHPVTEMDVDVVVKVQYPGVADSIESDVDNLIQLVKMTNAIPKGLYVDHAARIMKDELAVECDYLQESQFQMKYREILMNDRDLQGIYVPEVFPDYCSRRVITTEFVRGVPIDKLSSEPQEMRNVVGTLLLQLTLRELFGWRFMQTDPNFANFLYDKEAGRLNLIDFGAAREYPAQFVNEYMEMVAACANRDRQSIIDTSSRLGFLTGKETESMLNAHVESGFVVGLPFAQDGDQPLNEMAPFNFGRTDLTRRVRELGRVMLRERLTPPPQDAYSLHRRLSGAYLACIRLRAVVPCRHLFFDQYRQSKALMAASSSADAASELAQAVA